MKLSKELKIGAFVVLVLVMSFFLINYLRGRDLFNREIEVSSRYSDIEGLVESAPVYIKGYKAGKVIDVSYDIESCDFIVTCSIIKDFMIPDDSRMIIYGVDIMGGKGVRIDLGSSPVSVDDGGFLSASTEPAMLDGLAEGVTPIFEKVAATLDSLNTAVSLFNKVLSDKSIARTMAHMEHTLYSISSIASNLDGNSDELNSLMNNLASLSSYLIGLTSKADSLLVDAAGYLDAVDHEDLREVVVSFRDLLTNINDPDGTIGKLMTDGSVYDSVEDLLDDIDVLVRKIQENPKKYIKFSVF